MKRRIVIAGGSGFIGRALTEAFRAGLDDVTILTRSPQAATRAAREVFWDGRQAGEWRQWLDGADVLINLTGKNINCPHTPENLRAIIASRVDSVKVLAAACAQVPRPPKIWVQASATGFYGDTGNHLCDETSPVGTGSLAEICQAWEGAFAEVKSEMRKVTLRIGFVLGREGGAFPVLSRLTRSFLGGAAGNGRQFISWIHLIDLERMFLVAVADEKLSGIYNAVAPEPVTNAEFMRVLRQVWHRPWSPPVPAFALKLGAKLLGSEPTLVLMSQRCAARRFLEAGFTFQFPQLASALADLTT
jgi:uncharacterized protein